MITHRKITVDLGKEIHIYDGLVPLHLRDKFFCFAIDSLYRLGWVDSEEERAKKHKYLYSAFSQQDNEKSGLLPHLLGIKEIAEHFNGLTIKKSVVNLSVPSDTHFAHAHPEKKVLLYYANMSWEQHWHGETLFYSEDLKEILFAGAYTPGRVIVFDASIPHAMRPQSISADNYRYTFATTFD